jgi:sRNA-binding protein
MGPDPLRRRRGERVSDWMAWWRAAGLPLEGHPQPLAIGAFEHLLAQLSAEACSPNHFKRLLGSYCDQVSYVTGVSRSGAMRHDLDGRPVEPVSAEHQRAAVEQLEQRRRRRSQPTGANARTPTLRLPRARP